MQVFLHPEPDTLERQPAAILPIDLAAGNHDARRAVDGRAPARLSRPSSSARRSPRPPRDQQQAPPPLSQRGATYAHRIPNCSSRQLKLPVQLRRHVRLRGGINRHRRAELQHGLVQLLLLVQRVPPSQIQISAFISRMAFSQPSNTARATMAWPMLSSAMPGMAAMVCTFS